MEELTHPVVLSDEELDLVAAAGGECGCRGGEFISVDVSHNDIAVLNNINVLSAFTGPQKVYN
jgi:hypothetical protein